MLIVSKLKTNTIRNKESGLWRTLILARIEEHQGIVRLTADDDREDKIIRERLLGYCTISGTKFDHYSDGDDPYRKKALGVAIQTLTMGVNVTKES